MPDQFLPGLFIRTVFAATLRDEVMLPSGTKSMLAIKSTGFPKLSVPWLQHKPTHIHLDFSVSHIWDLADMRNWC